MGRGRGARKLAATLFRCVDFQRGAKDDQDGERAFHRERNRETGEPLGFSAQKFTRIATRQVRGSVGWVWMSGTPGRLAAAASHSGRTPGPATSWRKHEL